MIRHVFEEVGCIVQARMTSKRFPGKVVADLMGAPVIVQVLSRLVSVGFDRVIVAVPDNEAQQPILDAIDQFYDLDDEIGIFTGSEDNVLERYYEAASHFDLDYICRITADCPFIDPFCVEDVVDALLHSDKDYVSNVWPIRAVFKGYDAEAFTFAALEKAHNAATDTYDLEHVTPWMQRNLKTLNIAYEGRKYSDIDNLNLCVDYPEDIERLKELIKSFGDKEVVS